MLNSSNPRTHHRSSSRSNSTSSSSVVTIKRAASLSSRSGSQNPNATFNNSSPDSKQPRTGLVPPNPTAIDSKNTLRSIDTQNRPTSVGGLHEGIGTLNRWSQSTSSSKGSGQGLSQSQGHKKKKSFSHRLSFSGSSSIGSLKGLTSPQSPGTRHTLTKPRSSPVKTDQRNSTAIQDKQGPRATRPSRPVIDTNTSHSSSRLTASGTSGTPITRGTLTPTISIGPAAGDYFDDRWSRSPASQRTPEPYTPSTNNASKTFEKSHRSQRQSASGLSTPKDSRSRGHSRNREDPNKGSGGTEGGSSISSTRSDKDSARKRKSPSQKTMLSKALQKANTAVLLDNAQNFEGAMDAYAEACQLLQKVMLRSNGDDDKRKLEAIRTTYTNRIRELRNLDPSFQVAEGKALPNRPMSNDSVDYDSTSSPPEDDEDNAVIETATATRIMNTAQHSDRPQSKRPDTRGPVPLSQRLLPSALLEDSPRNRPEQSKQPVHRESYSKPFSNTRKKSNPNMLNLPMEPEYMPPPLSPRRPSPAGDSSDGATATFPASKAAQVDKKDRKQISSDTTNGSTSWLDTIDESGGSSASSVHSRSSSFRMRRKPIRSFENDTEAEFGAALDAAVEAAYDDGYEVADDFESSIQDDTYNSAKRNVELAKAKVRQAELEDTVAQQKTSKLDSMPVDAEKVAGGGDYLDEEAEEEERLLEEMTKAYAMDDFEFDLQSMSALPRQSDSSGFSGKTWASSSGSNTATTGTSLTTLTESATEASKMPPPRPPPAGALPMPPIPQQKSSMPSRPSMPPPRPPSFGAQSGPGVRDRRLSGQKAKELKIQTSNRAASQPPNDNAAGKPSSLTQHPADANNKSVRDMISNMENRPRPNISRAITAQVVTPMQPMVSGELSQNAGPATPTFAQTTGRGLSENAPIPPSPGRLITKVPSAPEGLRKNVSSTSLKSRNIPAETSDIPEPSPGLPSANFYTSADPRKPVPATTPAMPTPTGATFAANGLPTGGMYLFDDHLESPGTPNQRTITAPVPLEPCPDSFLLRPFWLMRCLYQTIAHPRGGYVTSKLFVPRDVWRVKNVKLKGVDEKVAHCDLLTAALQKLGKVDTLDADAVLEEMQSLEGVLDQVRGSLAKKLGNEVGVHSSSTLFKGSIPNDDSSSHADMLSSKSSNLSGKFPGWRKLRSKSSNAGLISAVAAINREGGKDTLSMSSLPMTSAPSSRPPKRMVSQIQCAGPHANYMGALARLFDAVQVLGK
ncbi:MAG: hypothetical protein Q9227_003099 [Pyrenula ochraceoflavens]